MEQVAHPSPRTRSRSRRAEINATEYDRDPLDFYIEDEWCWDAIFQRHKFLGTIWDPWAGSGTLGRAAKRYGYGVVLTDIADRGPHLHHQIDFLGDVSPYRAGRQNICGNPPYGMPHKGICYDMTMRALELATHQVCMLYQNKFLHGGSRARQLFQRFPPRCIYIFGDRPNMPPGDQLLSGTVKRGGGTKDYVAIVWDKTYEGPTATHWLTMPGKIMRGSNGKAKKEAPDRGQQD